MITESFSFPPSALKYLASFARLLLTLCFVGTTLSISGLTGQVHVSPLPQNLRSEIVHQRLELLALNAIAFDSSKSRVKLDALLQEHILEWIDTYGCSNDTLVCRPGSSHSNAISTETIVGPSGVGGL